MAQLVNTFIACKHKDLSLDPQNLCKKASIMVQTCDSTDEKIRGRERWTPRILWVPYLACVSKFQANETLSQRRWKASTETQGGYCPLISMLCCSSPPPPHTGVRETEVRMGEIPALMRLLKESLCGVSLIMNVSAQTLGPLLILFSNSA